ncbi:DNA translocase FtsK [Brevundimonas phoenicis]|uniref:DNA translocase FtsK n=1 Tax=unclassified Brevundimonas TaxID=2622653 RepID=UPI0039A1922C
MPTSSPDDYVNAVRLVQTERKPSPSFLQRRMGLGYAEASALIERMERAGVVGHRARNGTREILTPPAPPADGSQAPPRPRTPEDGRAIQTPEDGRPVHTR